MKKFPELYKQNNTGKIQFWHIAVTQSQGRGVITTTFGQYGTDKPQRTQDFISAGKNIGRSNETSVIKQAKSQAKSKWESQLKRGYVESYKDAEKGKLDKIIKGGIVPMTCHTYKDHKKKIKFPCDAQPKYDGHRCIAIVRKGKCTLWSRSRKQIFSCPHIVKALEKRFRNITLDGELYNHKYRRNFEQLMKLIRPQKPVKGHKKIQFHIFDIVANNHWTERLEELNDCENKCEDSKCLHFAETLPIKDEKGITNRMKRFLAMGYEGMILRNRKGTYLNTRSYDVLKHKEMRDAEFKCVGIQEGKGKLRGHVGSFICVNKKGTKFKAKMEGAHGFLKKCYKNHKLWANKMLTVKYQDLTGKNKVPRFPIAIRFREKGE